MKPGKFMIIVAGPYSSGANGIPDIACKTELPATRILKRLIVRPVEVVVGGVRHKNLVADIR